MTTHKDWVRARDERNAAGRRAVRYLLFNQVDAAIKAAIEWDGHDGEMYRIESELDGQS